MVAVTKPMVGVLPNRSKEGPSSWDDLHTRTHESGLLCLRPGKAQKAAVSPGYDGFDQLPGDLGPSSHHEGRFSGLQQAKVGGGDSRPRALRGPTRQASVCSGSSRLEGMQLGPPDLNRASRSEVISISFPCMRPTALGSSPEERKSFPSPFMLMRLEIFESNLLKKEFSQKVGIIRSEM